MSYDVMWHGWLKFSSDYCGQRLSHPEQWPKKTSKAAKNAENINTRLKLVMKSGKYNLGHKSTMKTLRNGKAKLVLIASNCPPLRKSEIEYYAMLSKTGVHHYTGRTTSWALPVENTSVSASCPSRIQETLTLSGPRRWVCELLDFFASVCGNQKLSPLLAQTVSVATSCPTITRLECPRKTFSVSCCFSSLCSLCAARDMCWCVDVLACAGPHLAQGRPLNVAQVRVSQLLVSKFLIVFRGSLYHSIVGCSPCYWRSSWCQTPALS